MIRPLQRNRHRGISQIEVVISTIFVVVTLTVAMQGFGLLVQTRSQLNDANRGELLARQLASEILTQSYQEPVDSPSFGRESGELASNRADYDDVDDYDAWIASPPEDGAGNALQNSEGWERQVDVYLVSSTNPNGISVPDQGVKRIVITVSKHGRQVSQLILLRGAGETR